MSMPGHERKTSTESPTARQPPNGMLVPLALAQFVASFAASSMNVAIGDITRDLDMTVTGVQTVITLFTLTMAALMIPGSKLTDIWGRKRCFVWGLIVYGIGALIATFATGSAGMFIGYSFLEGVGSALMIPPIYVLTTVSFSGVTERARAFAIISAMAALGASAGPLLGGFIISSVSWRASFFLQAVLVCGILVSSRRIKEPPLTGPKPSFDLQGGVLSGLGLVAIVFGVLQMGTYGLVRARKDGTLGPFTIHQGDVSPALVLLAIGILLLLGFLVHVRRCERLGREPLLSSVIFKSRVSNLGLLTQNLQWLMMIGSFFVISVFLQVSQGYSAIETGIALTPATIGILLASWQAQPMAKRFSQRTLISSGFLLSVVGFLLLLAMVDVTSPMWAYIPGLFVTGIGVGIMLTASVNVVQSAFPEQYQGQISGLSRAASNLGSSFGTAIAGAILVLALTTGITRLTDESTVLDSAQKSKVEAALQGDVSAVSDTQMRSIVQGQTPPVVDEIVRINAAARDHAVGLALFGMALIGLGGFAAAMLLPPEDSRQRSTH